MVVKGLARCFWLSLLSFSLQAESLSLEQQRELYFQSRQAITERDWDKYTQLEHKLRDYPLKPYLEFYEIQRDFGRHSTSEIRKWVDRNQGIPLANTLEHRYLTHLGQQRRWKDFLRFYPQQPNSIALQCYYFRARLSQGDQQAALEGTKALWLHGRSRPDACDPLFEWMAKHDKLTDQLIWERMELAFQAHQPGLMSYLERKIQNEALSVVAKRMIETYQNPKRLLNAKDYPNGGRHSRAVVWLGMDRLARQDPVSALDAWSHYENWSGMDDPARVHALKDRIARYAMFKDAALPDGWLEDWLHQTQDSALVELQIRKQLKTSNWKDVARWIQVLPEDKQASSTWRFWLARSYEHAGQSSKADPMFSELAGERSFYGFLSAQLAGLPYSFEAETGDEAVPAGVDWLDQITELRAIDNETAAIHLWRHRLHRETPEIQKQLAAYALSQQWFDLSVNAALATGAHDRLDWRFPHAYSKDFEKAGKKYGITPTLLTALSRQESAFQRQVSSSANARGLMQLLPSTAKQTAGKAGIPYKGAADLYLPETNIQLGSRYLNDLLGRFDEMRPMALAAYNAGPSRVKRWHTEELPYDLWIETIPYRETRNYVKNVLSFDLIYRWKRSESLYLLTPEEMAFTY